MIVVRLNVGKSRSDYDMLYMELCSQVRNGVMLLPSECELVAYTDDTDIKVVKNDQARD